MTDSSMYNVTSTSTCPRVTTQYNDLETDEINILTGALRLKQKCVKVTLVLLLFLLTTDSRVLLNKTSNLTNA